MNYQRYMLVQVGDGPALNACLDCGSAVPDTFEYRERHDKWHDRMERASRNASMLNRIA